MGRGTISAKSGDLLVATISFKAKVSSGNATVSFVGGTEADKAGKVIVSATSAGTYTFTEPPPPPKPKPKDTKAPTISDVQVVDIGLNKATIAWKTNEKAKSIVEYGPSKQLGIMVSNTSLKTSHKISLSTKLLFPGTTYYYVVKSKDAAGNEAKSKLTSFKTSGYNIKLKIIGLEEKPLVGAKITLIPGLETETSDQNGIASFEDVAAGVHSVQVQVGEQVLASIIEVEEADDPEKVQDFDVKVAAAATTKGDLIALADNTPILAVAALLILLIISTAGGFIWFRKKKKL